MQNNEFKIEVGNCCKTGSRIYINKIFYIPKDSNVIFLGVFDRNPDNIKTIRILYMGTLYEFQTIYSPDTWLKVLDTPTTRE